MSNFRDGDSVLVIDETGQNLGQMRYQQAQFLASERGLDLIEMDASGANKVVKIMDKGKWKYEQKKKNKHHRSHAQVIKEVKFSMNIDAHDQSIKVNHMRDFLEKGHTVRTVVELRGREKQHFPLAIEKLQSIVASLTDVGKMNEKGINRSSNSVSTDILALHRAHK